MRLILSSINVRVLGMPHYRICILLFCLISSRLTFAQTDPLRIHSSLGLATYYGDLKEKAKLIDQSSLAFNLGASYDITDQILLRFDFSIMTLKGDDQFNKRKDFIERNLNFKSTVWETNFSVQYDFLNMNSEDYFLSPYVFAGFGFMHMNPWTIDRNGVKRFLKGYNTEGQGLPSYPDRKEYGLFNIQIPFGAGIKYALNENVNVYLELAFRKLFTDYLDDIGNTYPDRNILLNESRDPATTIGLTFRGDELNPSLPYPSTFIQRGGYSKDFFYTFGLGVSMRLGGIPFLSGEGRGGFNKIRRVGSARSRLRNPGSVF